MSSETTHWRSVLAAAGLVAGIWALPAPASAERCPSSEPTSIRGRVVVHEPNKNPPGLRGVGEVFVYAYPVGRPDSGKRKIAVTDPKGHFCIHDTAAGKWVVTSAQPFQFRPFVRQLDCQPGSCDLGAIRIDESLLRISDDYIGFDGDWWGGPYAQTVTAPSKAESINAITFRSAGKASPEIQILEGKSLSGNLLGRDTISFSNKSSRETAFFRPGKVTVTPSKRYTVYFNGSGNLWRQTGDPYSGGQMFNAGGGSLSPISNTDMCLTADVDGPDGLMTSHYSAGQNDAVRGTRIAQQFVARSEAITHVSLFVGTPKGNHRIRASVGTTPDGPAIGGVRETGVLEQQPGAFAWAPGVVDVTPGTKYWIRFEFPGTRKAIYLDTDNPATGPMWIDGRQKKGAFWGRIMGPKTATDKPGWGGDAGGGGDRDTGPPTTTDTGTTDSGPVGTSDATSMPTDTGGTTGGGGRADLGADADASDTSGEFRTAGCNCTQQPERRSPLTHLLLGALLLGLFGRRRQ